MTDRKVNYIIGCSGFVVPRDQYYKQFNAVEVKEFYLSLIKEKTARQWKESAPPGFVFSLVAPRWIVEPPEPGEKSTLLTGNRDNYGEFKLTEENLSLYRWLYSVARILESPTILFITPGRWGPDKRHKEQMIKFFSEVPRDGVNIVWEPRGLWSTKELEQLARELDISIAFDPLKEGPKVIHEPFYARISPLSSFSPRLTMIQWDRFINNLRIIENGTVYIYFGTQGSFYDAIKLKQSL